MYDMRNLFEAVNGIVSMVFACLFFLCWFCNVSSKAYFILCLIYVVYVIISILARLIIKKKE